MSTFKIRAYDPKDRDAVYNVCLKTGDAGDDGTQLYNDPDILGHLYVGPYVTLEPELAFVLEDEAGVCGYVLGAMDSNAFYERFVDEWLPTVQQQVPDPTGNPEERTRTEQLYHFVHHPIIHLPDALKAYPSHLHIDLLPRAQGQGNGTRMMRTLLDILKEKGSSAVHLGLSSRNARALAFYKKMGFHLIESSSDNTLYMGMRL